MFALPKGQRGFSSILIIVLVLLIAVLGAAYFLLFNKTSIKPTSTTLSKAPKRIGIMQWVKQLDPGVDGFKKGMTDLGYVEGKNVEYEYTSVDASLPKTHEVAKKYFAENVDMIYAVTGPNVKAALQEATASGKQTPIVFEHGDFPLEDGFIKSFKSSGNNSTGVATEQTLLTAKRIEFLKQINPNVKRIGVFQAIADRILVTKLALAELKKAAKDANIEVVQYDISDPTGPGAKVLIQQTADKIKPGDIDAIMTIPDGTINFQDNPKILIALGSRLKIPTFFLVLPNVIDGALIAYNADETDMGVQAAGIADKIFKGTAPSDIPIEYPRKNQLYVNLKTAKAIGITIPDSILSIADKRIE